MRSGDDALGFLVVAPTHCQSPVMKISAPDNGRSDDLPRVRNFPSVAGSGLLPGRGPVASGSERPPRTTRPK